MRCFPELFLRKASVDNLRAIGNFVTFSGKPDWLKLFLLELELELQPAFLFEKGWLSQIISKLAVQKRSLK